MQPNLHDYDWVLINSSAGKDSQAMLTYLVEFADSVGSPREKLVVAHADLGRVEWKDTMELAEKQAKCYGLRFLVTKNRTHDDLLAYVERRGKWPDSKNRWCTSDFKRDPVGRVLTQLSKELRVEGIGRPVKILNCLGIRAEESSARAKKIPFQVNKRATGKGTTKQVDEWYPIFDLTIPQVWDIIKRSGVPHHRAYDVGMPRLSCCFCIFAPKDALLLSGEHNRELLDVYVEVEERVGHDFKHKFKIKEIQEALDRGERFDRGTLEDEGKNWSM